MNRLTLALATVMIAASTHASAQVPAAGTRTLSDAAFAKARTNYAACLASDNAGLVESAIAMVVRLGIMYPDRAMTGIADRLHELAGEGKTPSIRYKAHLASMVIDSPTLHIGANEIAALDNTGLFALVAGRLQVTLLGYSAN